MGNLLVPFKKFLSNKNTITILGVLIGIVVLYLGYNWRVTKSVQPVRIPYSNTTMIAGTKITENNIQYASVPKDMISNMTNLVTDTSQIVGKLVAYDAKIPQNSFFYDTSLMTEEEMPDSIFSGIQDGYTIYDMQVTMSSAYGNSIFPNDSIDIYMSTEAEDDENKLVYGRFIKSIQVLAVKDGNGKNVFADKDNPTETAHLLFAVPENLFLLLKKAEKLGITLEPIPRNNSYSKNAAATELTSDELQAMIINQTHILQNECTDLTVCG
ncbi:MAG: hypothetical protein K2H20_00390 [Bacilli bacterium]|nr:hypothetical protein [Bacilli bacterium]